QILDRGLRQLSLERRVPQQEEKHVHVDAGLVLQRDARRGHVGIAIESYGKSPERRIRRGCGDISHDQPNLSYAPASRSAATMRSGVNGASVNRTPNGESASSMALTIAAAAGIVPPSPAPLTPRGLSGFGVSMCSMRHVGRSAAVGRR